MSRELSDLARGVRLNSGRILSCAGCGFTYSDDAGMTWCPPYEARYVDGSVPKLQNLVDLKTAQRWTNHTICALQDRVLILYAGKCKVLPLKWFYRGGDPFAENIYFRKLAT